MTITFIFGNGFDIHLGLKTKYSQFLDVYTQETSEDDDEIKDFKQYLQNRENRELWSDAELGMGAYLGSFSDADLEKYVVRVRDFELKMFDYLQEQQNLVSYEEEEKIREVFSDFILSSYKDVLNRRASEINASRLSNNSYRFISFNYTDLLDTILSITASQSDVLNRRWVGSNFYQDTYNEKVYHVHGALESQIIMGVNDESQLDLSGGVTLGDRLRRLLIKSSMNSQSRHEWDQPAKKVIASSDIIYIYGVSYGQTDALWWEEIREWLISEQKHKLVAFIRDSGRGFSTRLPWEEIDYEEDKRRDILKKLLVSEDDPQFERLLNQVYIILNTTRLDLRDVLHPAERLVAAAI